MENKKFIRIRGAAENNLKHIDLDIPRDELVVLTGLPAANLQYFQHLAFPSGLKIVLHKMKATPLIRNLLIEIRVLR